MPLRKNIIKSQRKPSRWKRDGEKGKGRNDEGEKEKSKE